MLTAAQHTQTAAILKSAGDEYIRQPLWEFPPDYRPLVIHERRRRFGVQDEIGDPEYG